MKMEHPLTVHPVNGRAIHVIDKSCDDCVLYTSERFCGAMMWGKTQGGCLGAYVYDTDDGPLSLITTSGVFFCGRELAVKP
jgi:hypothetical protein